MDKALIIDIVKQIIAELRSGMPSRQVLILFSGASTGFVAVMDAIKLLTGQGHRVTVFFTPSAVKIITPEHAQKAGATNIILPEMWVDAPSLARNTDLVLVPTLSMNTAARLAQGLMDTLMSTLIMGALLAGKPVLAIKDGADPYGNGGLIFGAQPGVATALKDRLAQHLETLASFGLELINEPNFLAAVEARLLGLRLQAETPPLPNTPQPPVSPPPVPFVGTQFITESDLLSLPLGASICVPAGARFTPLAKDTIIRLKLNVVVA